MVLSKKLNSPLGVLIVGFFIIFIGRVISNLIEFLYFRYQLTNFSISEITNLYSQGLPTSQIIKWIILLISSFSLIFAGYWVGIKMKSRAWIYGIILGIIWFIFMELGRFLSLIVYKFKPVVYISPEIKNAIISKQINKIIFGIFSLEFLKPIFLTTLGSWLGEYREKNYLQKILDKNILLSYFFNYD